MTTRQKMVIRGFATRDPLPRNQMSSADLVEFVYGWSGMTATELCYEIENIMPGKGKPPTVGGRLHKLSAAGLIRRIVGPNNYMRRQGISSSKLFQRYGPNWHRKHGALRWYPALGYQPRFQAIVAEQKTLET
jgi:hypothetical protein